MANPSRDGAVKMCREYDRNPGDNEKRAGADQRKPPVSGRHRATTATHQLLNSSSATCADGECLTPPGFFQSACRIPHTNPIARLAGPERNTTVRTNSRHGVAWSGFGRHRVQHLAGFTVAITERQVEAAGWQTDVRRQADDVPCGVGSLATSATNACSCSGTGHSSVFAETGRLFPARRLTGKQHRIATGHPSVLACLLRESIPSRQSSDYCLGMKDTHNTDQATILLTRSVSKSQRFPSLTLRLVKH